VCIIRVFSGLSVSSENFDPSSKKNLQTTEEILSSLNLTSSDCQVETAGSPKKKQKHDDTGIIKLF